MLDETVKYNTLTGFNRDELMRGHKLVYSEGAGKLIVCGGQREDEFGGNWIDSDSIWLCDITRSFQVKGYNWRELSCKLPYGGKTFGIICAYGSIIIIMYLRDEENKDIYCLDLLEQEKDYKFIKSDQVFPVEGDCEYTDVITTDDDMVHCMYFSIYGHCRLSLYHIIPNEMKNKYKLRYIKSVYGFIRQKIDQTLLNKIPDSVITGISKYLSELCCSYVL